MLFKMEDIKKFFDYIFFREPGEIGEGGFVSVFFWFFVFVIVLCLGSMVGKYFSWF